MLIERHGRLQSYSYSCFNYYYTLSFIIKTIIAYPPQYNKKYCNRNCVTASNFGQFHPHPHVCWPK